MALMLVRSPYCDDPSRGVIACVWVVVGDHEATDHEEPISSSGVAPAKRVIREQSVLHFGAAHLEDRGFCRRVSVHATTCGSDDNADSSGLLLALPLDLDEVDDRLCALR